VSALLKTGTQARVRPLGMALAADPADDAERALRAELAEAHAGLEARDEEIARLRRDGKTAVAEAAERGRAAGREEADARTDEALAALRGGLASALEALDRDLAALERLAPALAVEALERVFGPQAPQADAVAASLDLQLRRLSRDAVLCASVAAEDFPDAEALAALAAATGVRIEALPELERGACRLRLRLGGLEIGPAQQWARLRETLLAAAAPGQP
jgi:flagellar biosynthesis/type III secretory pathway protein FliH